MEEKQKVRRIKTLRQEEWRDGCALIVLIEYKGRKFKVKFENSNGDPLGFDYKHCIDVLDSGSGTWKHVADRREIVGLMKSAPDFSPYGRGAYLTTNGAWDFVKACEEYIKLIY